MLSVGGTNTAFAALNARGTTHLYTVDLVSVAATVVGAVGGNPNLRGLAVSSGSIGVPGGGAGGAIGLPVNSWLAMFLIGLLMADLGVLTLRKRARI